MYKIYFAGDLFDHKHMAGNVLLSQHINTLSNNRYDCLLPQDWEAMGDIRPLAIRNKDLSAVITSDLAIFNFDGVDLDSGTVVEFMIAKMLDIPAVLLRTDFRNGGYWGDDWNLMVSGYPRSIVVKQPVFELYKRVGMNMHTVIAQAVIEGLDQVVQEKSLFSSYEEAFFAYQHVVKMCGSDLEKLVPASLVHELIAKKISNNIYSWTQSKSACAQL